MRINERAQIFFYFLSHFLLTISRIKSEDRLFCIERRMGDCRKLLTHIKNVLYLSIVLTILPMMWMEEKTLKMQKMGYV